MRFVSLGLGALTEVSLQERTDERGFFARLFCQEEFQRQGLNSNWEQINNSMTHLKGTVRGLHFQRPPASEVKLVRCVRGAIFDVAVDLRKGSKTFGQWKGLTLTAESRSMLYIPEGFAHGFQTLEDDSEIIYFNSTSYDSAREGGVRCDDPGIGINWPLPVVGLSLRDRAMPSLSEVEPIESA